MASIGFRWLDILEKEFDKAFVDLDLNIGDWESEEPDFVFNVRQKLCTLTSCFAQLTHKAQTVFQNSAKIEAELIHMRAELVDSKSKREGLEQELHTLLLQLHSAQLSHLPDSLDGKKQDPNFKPDVNNIKKKLEAELRISPTHTYKTIRETDDSKMSPVVIENAQFRIENAQLQHENASLRNSILGLNSEVYGAKLAAKYLDKELAGRIQQLQLLGREMRGEVRDKLWRQLESEILLQRHKTVVRACRRNSVMNGTDKQCVKPPSPPLEPDTANEETIGHFGDIRTIVVKRKSGQGLGISITGGREHGVPVLISELEPRGPAAVTKQLYIGDAILFVNDRDLRQACHREAVDILQQQSGDCILQVQYIAADDSDNSLEEESFNFRFFDGVADTNNSVNINASSNCLDVLNTPTAPRTPESSTASRTPSRNSAYNCSDTANMAMIKPSQIDYNKNNTNNKLNIYQKVLLDSKISNQNFHSKLNIESKSRSIDTTSTDIKNYNQKLVDNNKEYQTNMEINRNVLEGHPTSTNAKTGIQEKDLDEFNKNTDFLCKIIPFMDKKDISIISDLLLNDNRNDLIKLDNFKKDNVEKCNLNSSMNSLTSDNFSSPMQTSTDMFLDSEILSTDVASNDSQSPKNIQTEPSKVPNKFTKYKKPEYHSNDSFSVLNSDHSLLNSDESCASSPLHKVKRDYRKVQRKHKKKYFGVKTLQSIFNKHDGYSDVSTTASDFEIDEPKCIPAGEEKVDEALAETTVYKCSAVYTDTSPQFEENIHNILSDIFVKNFPNTDPNSSNSINKPTAPKKYFSLHGQHLRVGKALRLCPNENVTEVGNEQRKEKLLARYVYNSAASSGEGVGDPFFGTPV